MHAGIRRASAPRSPAGPRARRPWSPRWDRAGVPAPQPEPLVPPLVMYWTTRWRSKADAASWITIRPRYRTAMRSATSNTSFKLWEITITARPRSRRRRTRSSTIFVWTTPRAAVGSSSSTSLEFHITAFATATDCRWPPESEPTGWRIDRTVVTRRLARVSAASRSIASSSRSPPRRRSRTSRRASPAGGAAAFGCAPALATVASLTASRWRWLRGDVRRAAGARPNRGAERCRVHELVLDDCRRHVRHVDPHGREQRGWLL